MFRKLSIFGLAGVLVLVGGGLATALAGNNITSPETLVLTERRPRRSSSMRVSPVPDQATCSSSSVRSPTRTAAKAGSIHGQCTLQIGHWLIC